MRDRATFERRLATAVEGLLYQSETDAPVEPFVMEGYDGDELTPERLREFLGRDRETRVETVAFADFFAPLAENQDWYGDEERETAKRYRRLQRLLERSLRDLRVYKVGETEVDVYVLGRTRDDRFAGVRTRAVET